MSSPTKKAVAIIQARMGSTRLPGKVLKKVNDTTLLEYQIERVKRAALIDEIVIATTTNKQDDLIVKFCEKLEISYYRGSEQDVLRRYYEAAQKYEAEIIVRLTSDCPLIDPDLINQVLQFYKENEDSVDYVSNTLERTYPRGLDVEVFSVESLNKAHINAKLPRDREHVTAYIYTNPDKFKLLGIRNDNDYSDYRWTVDTIEDYKLIEKIIIELYTKKKCFSFNDVLQVLEQNPTWKEINAEIEQKKI